MLINLLGSLEVIVGGRAIELKGRRKRALVAFLAMHANEPVSTSELVLRLWGEDPPANARRSLRNAISLLRATLATEQPASAQIVGAETCYQLVVPEDAVDLEVARKLGRDGRVAYQQQRPAEAAELLRQAIHLWRGTALCDVVVPGGAWPELAELREEHLTLLEDHMEADCAAGRHADVVEELQTLIRAEPLRERLYAILMTALLGAGRSEEALAVYQDACAMLADEWGIDPGQDLRELREMLAGRQSAPVTAARTTISEATVLMLRPSGFPAAAEDPEEEARLLDQWCAVVGKHIERRQGRILLSLGNSVLAVFETERSAECAVVAALAAQAALASAGAANSIGRITMSAAIATGEVRTAPYHPGDGAFLLTGDAVDACRGMLSAAPEGGVLVAESTYRASRHAIAYQPWSASPAVYQARGIATPDRVASPAVADRRTAQGVGAR